MAGDRVLLAHHRKLGRWLQPGGHSDGDPDTLAVALREAREESGLDVQALDDAIFDLDLHRIPARDREPAHLHFDVRSPFRPSTTGSGSATNRMPSRGSRRRGSAGRSSPRCILECIQDITP